MSKMAGKTDLKLADKPENTRLMFGSNFKASENLQYLALECNILLCLLLRLVLKRREIKTPCSFPRTGLWNQVIQTSDCCFVFTG